jgi:carbamoyl-phosphate synthase large subunit
MGGQTALNLCLEADEKNLADFGVRMIGVDVNAINITENREQFKQLLKKIGISICACRNMYFYLRGKEIAQNLVSFSDTSFLYFRRYWSGYCIKERILMCF